MDILEPGNRKARLRRTVSACEVARTAPLPASGDPAAITGEVLHVTAGIHIEGMVFH